jgi:hypothetical protein
VSRSSSFSPGSLLVVAAIVAAMFFIQNLSQRRRAAAQRERLYTAQKRVTGGTPPPDRPRPQLRINGRPVDEATDVLRKLRLAAHKTVVEAGPIGFEDATDRFGRSMKWGFGIIYVVVGGLLLGLAVFAGTPTDREWLVPYIVLLLIALAVVMPFAYAYKMRKFRARMERVNSPAPAGSQMRLDDSGFAIAGRSIPWSALTLDTVDFTRVPARYESYYVIEGLSLKNGDDADVIELHLSMLTNGHALLDNVFERLCPAAV